MRFEQYCKAISVVEERTGCDEDTAIAVMEEVTSIFGLEPEETLEEVFMKEIQMIIGE